MMLYDWLVEIIGQPISTDLSMVLYIVSSVIVIIGVTLALSLFIGIATAIFRR